MDQIKFQWSLLSAPLMNFLPKLVLALFLLILGLKLSRYLKLGIERFWKKRKLDPSIEGFFINGVDTLFKAVLFLSMANILGLQTTSLIAVLGSAGLAIGLALQGALSHVAGGFLILFLRPFKVGDFVEVAGHKGHILSIQLFHTTLRTPDYRIVILPNSHISNGVLVNYSREGIRRVDILFSISYEDSIEKAKQVILENVKQLEELIEGKEMDLHVRALSDSSVDIEVRFFVPTSHYWKCYFTLMERVKNAFDKEGIVIPYPQRQVHLTSKES